MTCCSVPPYPVYPQAVPWPRLRELLTDPHPQVGLGRSWCRWVSAVVIPSPPLCVRRRVATKLIVCRPKCNILNVHHATCTVGLHVPCVKYVRLAV